MKKLVAVRAVALLAMPAMAAPFYIGASFNGWTSNGDGPMAEITPNAYYTLSTSQAGGQGFKVTDGTWDNSWPANNVEINFDAGATAELRFWPGVAPNDGWYPRQNRVGYDINLHGWEVMGSFNGWASPVLSLTDQGGGLYTGDLVVATAGTYEFKYRKTGDWGTSIGDLEGNGAFGNIVITTTVDGETLSLGIDMPSGRYRIPEPTTLALLGFGGLAMIRRRQ